MKKILFLILVLSSAFIYCEDTAKDDDFNINLWPLLSYTDNSDGGKDLSALFIFNRKTDDTGRQIEMFLFPLFYNFEKFDGKHFGSIIWIGGPGYKFIPPLLSGSWSNSSGGKTTWVTPLFHSKTNSEGKVENLHLLNYFHSPGAKILAPIAWSVETRNGTHHGFIPIYAKGPSYWTVPLGLSLGWENRRGESTTWITPLFHMSSDSDKRLKSFHIFNIYSFKEKDSSYSGVVPIWFKGPSFWFFLPTLTWTFVDWEGDRNTWVTPLFHLSLDKTRNLKSFHFINTYFAKGENGNYWGFIPVWFKGPEFWGFPLGLSWSNTDFYGNKSTWITPLFHLTLDRKKEVKSFHFANIYAFREFEDEEMHKGFFPVWFDGPGYWAVPPALSVSWTKNREKHTWITPLFHQRKSEDGEIVGFHYLNFYGYETEDGWKKGFAPFWYKGPNYWFSPLVLSAGWENKQGDKNLWLTPLFHRTVNKDNEHKSSHFLNYISITLDEEKHRSLFPFVFKGSDYWAFTPLLSGGWENEFEDKSTWLTPLFHVTRNEAEGVSSFHIGPYIMFDHNNHILLPFAWFFGKDYEGDKPHYGLFPLFAGGPNYFISPVGYGFGEEDNFHFGLFPFFAKNPKSLVIPPLLTVSWRDKYDNSRTWVTPLFHKNSNSKGETTSLHLLNYYYSPDFSTLFPISYSWRGYEGKYSMFLPPLFGSYKGEELTDSLLFHMQPFNYQRAGDQFELNILWRLFHLKRDSEMTEFTLGPIWNSNDPRNGEPMEYQLLGGLFAKDVNYIRKLYRYRAFWFVTLGDWKTYYIGSGIK